MHRRAGDPQSRRMFFLIFSTSSGSFVRLPRPEEAAQAILLAPRHDVDVQVRNALADAVVDGHESAVRHQRQFHRARQQLGIREIGLNQRGGGPPAFRNAVSGISSVWPGNTGRWSRNASDVSSSKTDGRGDRASDDLAEEATRPRLSHDPSRDPPALRGWSIRKSGGYAANVSGWNPQVTPHAVTLALRAVCTSTELSPTITVSRATAPHSAISVSMPMGCGFFCSKLLPP